MLHNDSYLDLLNVSSILTVKYSFENENEVSLMKGVQIYYFSYNEYKGYLGVFLIKKSIVIRKFNR